MNYDTLFLKQINEKKSFLCVGLDTDINKIPDEFKKNENPILAFNKDIIEQTADYAAAYKPNMAFYEAFGIKGLQALLETCKILNQLNIPVVLDAKRGDIGNTAKYYAQSIFDEFNVESTTLAPYMGWDSISPFAEYKNKLSFILGLTSNQSAKDFELLEMKNGKKLYETVIEQIEEWRKTTPNLGLVVGATQESELEAIGKTINQTPLLVPGVGAQGGSLEAVVKHLFQDNVLLINMSRSIIYADKPKEAAKKVQKQMQDIAGL